MSALEVRICARGSLTHADRLELPEFEERIDGPLLVLRGRVLDHPALLGVLDRLRRAGLSISDIDVAPAGCPAGGPAVARFEFQGQLGELLRHVVRDGRVNESATTTLEVELTEDQESLFRILTLLEDMALEFTEVHVRERPGENG